MATRELWNEQWQPFTVEIRERSGGDLTQHTREIWEYIPMFSNFGGRPVAAQKTDSSASPGD
jgi:hypothetical protein